MNVIIQRATAADAQAVIEYLKLVGGETDNLSFGAEGVPFSVEAEAQYLSRMEHSHNNVMILAKENGNIVGSASLARLSGRMSHRGEIAVTVRKEFWNRGIGGQLVTKIIELAKAFSFDIIDLQVRSDNTAAIHLYERNGFKKFGTHPAFFKMENKEISCDYMYLKIQ